MSGKVAMQPESGKRWFIVQTQVNRERQARQHLLQQRFEVYLPMRLSERRDCRHPITPFFPRYMFVRFDPDVEQWLSICSTVGVQDILRSPRGLPTVCPSRVVARVKEMEVDGVIHLVGAHQKAKVAQFKKGDKVRVTEGWLKDLEGTVLMPRGIDRAVVLLKVAQQGESALKIALHTSSLAEAGVR